jgi:hypothetical protein
MRIVDTGTGEMGILGGEDEAGVGVACITTPARRTSRRVLGQLDGQFAIPEDFDTLAAEEIQGMFEGK